MAHKVDLAGRVVWYKTYPAPRPIRTAVFNGVVHLLGLGLLATPRLTPGRTPAEEEAARLRTLANHGVRVPALYRATPEALWLEDLGPSLASHLKRRPAADRVALAQSACQALAWAHARGAWLGQAFARNLAVDAQGQVGFLDVENDPTSRMSLAQAQARDWLCLAQSLVGRVEPLDRVLALGLGQAQPAVYRALDKAVHRLARWLRLAPRTRAARAVQALRSALAQTAPLFDLDSSPALA